MKRENFQSNREALHFPPRALAYQASRRGDLGDLYLPVKQGTETRSLCVDVVPGGGGEPVALTWYRAGMPLAEMRKVRDLVVRCVREGRFRTMADWAEFRDGLRDHYGYRVGWYEQAGAAVAPADIPLKMPVVWAAAGEPVPRSKDDAGEPQTYPVVVWSVCGGLALVSRPAAYGPPHCIPVSALRRPETTGHATQAKAGCDAEAINGGC